MHDSVPCAKGFWSRKFGLKIDEHIWSIPLLVTTETRLRVLQWKMLHNIDPTNISLCKMKVTDDQMYSYCNDVVNCIEHFFFDCPTIKVFFKLHWTIYSNHFWHSDPFNYCWCFVRNKQHSYGKVKTKRINHVILIAKMCISMYTNKTKQKLTPSFHCPWYLIISSGCEMFNNYCERLKNENCAHCN